MDNGEIIDSILADSEQILSANPANVQMVTVPTRLLYSLSQSLWIISFILKATENQRDKIINTFLDAQFAKEGIYISPILSLPEPDRQKVFQEWQLLGLEGRRKTLNRYQVASI